MTGPLLLCLTLTAASDKLPVAPEVDLDEMAELPASTFWMGVEHEPPAPEPPAPYGDTHPFEKPRHEVELPAFHLDVTEVTVRHFALFLTYAGGGLHYAEEQPIVEVNGAYRAQSGAAELPITHVDLAAARDYCRWAGKHLPTEAEYERAAAGEEGRAYPWPDDAGADCQRAVTFTGSTFCEDELQPVGSRPLGASPEGVLDLAGNAAEWTDSVFAPYEGSALTEPLGPAEGAFQVVRGGSFLDPRRQARAQARRAVAPDTRSSAIGFRCAYRPGDDDDGARRGELAPPEGPPPEAEEDPADLTSPAARPEVVVEGLALPTALATLGPELCVADAVAGTVACFDEATGEQTAVLEDLAAPVDVVVRGGRLIIADEEAGTVLAWTPGGEPQLLADGLPGIFRLAADDEGLAVATTSAVATLASTGGSAELILVAEELAEVTGLALEPGAVVFTEGADDDTTSVRVGRVPRSGGEVEVLLDEAALGEWLRPVDVAVLPASGELVIALVGRSFPRSSLPCTVPSTGGDIACFGYSPPRITRLVATGVQLVWATHRSVLSVRSDDDEPYRVLGPWTRASDLILDEGAAVWADEQTGRVYRAPVPPS